MGFFIDNFYNPDSAIETDPITIILYDASNNVIDSTNNAGSSEFTLISEADFLQSVNLVNSDKTVGGYG